MAIGQTPRQRAAMALGALGVVYGDIGTSPLYAMRECFFGAHAVPPTPANVLGVVSLIVWALFIVVSLKYLALVMRADNDGEGGILALIALVVPPGRERGLRNLVLVALGLFGAALLYGDGMITPAISVMSAVEGLETFSPHLDPYVEPIALAVLVVLFSIQSRGTHRIGRLFGPAMLVWFATLAALGVWWIVKAPRVLEALSPTFAIQYFAHNGLQGVAILGTVFLVVTGGEALYADMGHFGRRPIRLAWFTVALPALLINYLGQAALLLDPPAGVTSPFFAMVPKAILVPTVVLATFATIVASQAVISGAFSLTLQAIQLGYLPRMQITHTSSEEFGQIYLPLVNWILLGATIFLTVAFGSSSHLAAAYGMAVTTTMVITTLLLFFVMRDRWRWALWACFGVTVPLLTVDIAFLGANVLKIKDGGWFPLAIGLGMLAVMSTWRQGRAYLTERIASPEVTFEDLFTRFEEQPPLRVPGTEIHLFGRTKGVPPTLLRNLQHNGVMHETVLIVTAIQASSPFGPRSQRMRVESIREDIHHVYIVYGFMQQPNVPRSLEELPKHGVQVDLSTASYFLGRETLLPSKHVLGGMTFWRGHLFGFLARNQSRATAFYDIPPEQVLEIGAQVEL
ncbi:MAG: potassium transporter Kup [Myxococcales bacterium]|nr:potassium transporter Kup [Myxococcales bacterium]